MSGEEFILLVNDDRDVTKTLRDFLRGEGYGVEVARSGAEGLRRIREGAVALVLLNLALPDVKGAAVMRDAQQLDAPPEFIVITEQAALDAVIDAIEGGAVGYLPKPVDLARLGRIVRRVFERRRLLRENTRLQVELRGRLAESEALVEISSTVSSTLDIREALRRICRALARLLGADTAAAYLHDLGTDQLLPTAAYHVPKEYLTVLAAAPLPLSEQGFHASVWTERRPVWSDDVARDPRFSHEMFRSFRHQSGLILPLLIEDRVAGGFYIVWWTAHRRFEERELRMLDHVCEQVGLLLRNASLYEEAERNRHRLEVLNEVSRQLAAVHDTDEVLTLIVNQAARLVKAEAAGLRLLEGDDLVVGARTESAAPLMIRPRIKLGESLTGKVVAGGETVVVEDLSQDTTFDPAHKRSALEHGFRGFVGVPLKSRGRVLGALNVYTQGARHFLPDEIDLLAGLADQASTAIEKARLFRETVEGQQLLARLYRAAIAMQSSWDRDERLRAFVHAAREVLGFDRVNVFLLTSDGSGLELATSEGDDGAPVLVLPLGPGAGAYYEAFESRRPVAVLSDEDLRSVRRLDRAYLAHAYLRSRRFVVTPLVAGDRVIGVVSADNKPSRRPIQPGSVEPFSSLCQNLAIALEESRLYAETRAREQEATKLYGVTRQIATSLDRDRVLDLIVTQTIELTGCEASGIYVYDRERDGLVFGRGLNLDPDLTRGVFLKAGEGVGGRAFKERRPVWTRDRTVDPSLGYSPASRVLMEAKAPRSYLAVPIMSRDEVHGVLMEYFFSPHDFSPREIQLVSTLADHVALAFENVRLLEETRQREQEASTLSRGLALLNQATRALQRTLDVDRMLSGALLELANAFGADAALMNLLGADGGVLRSVGHWLSETQRRELHARRSGITAHVRETRQPLFIRDVEERRDMVHPENFTRGVKSIAALPVLGQQGRALGVLLLYYKTPQLFPDTVVRLLTSYADQLATALENAQIYEEAQTQRVRLAQIFDSTSDGILLVGRSGDIQAVNERAGELLGFDAGRAVGTPLADVLARLAATTPEAEHGLAALRGLLENPERGGAGDLDLRRHGRVIHWVGQATRAAAGAAIGLTLTLQDVTHERQVSQLKSDFVSFVTHQLRTPLSGIKWMLELAGQTPTISEELMSYVRDASDSAERLIGLVNDLLDASRLESGALKMKPQPTGLADLTRSVLDEVTTLVRARGHQLSVEGVETAPRVLADPQLLRQVILNLTSNAIKYTPAGGAVTVRIGRENGVARWAISDTGVGIPAAAQARLFEKFFRAENAATIETEGTGLGLYLVRLIVERLGGRVWCESEEGRGSTFLFTLPLSE